MSYEEIAAIMGLSGVQCVHASSGRIAIDNKVQPLIMQALTIAEYWKRVSGMQKENFRP